MSDELRGGEPIDEREARALLSIMFAERMGDAARALKVYADSKGAGAEAEIRALKSERDSYLAEVRRLSAIIEGAKPCLRSPKPARKKEGE